MSTNKLKLFTYRARAEYEDDPLIFVVLPDEMEHSVIFDICRTLENHYSDTNQDPEEWCSEFELWFRFMSFANAVPINTRDHHLDLSDVMEDYLVALGAASNNAKFFGKIIGNQALINYGKTLSGDDDGCPVYLSYDERQDSYNISTV